MYIDLDVFFLLMFDWIGSQVNGANVVAEYESGTSNRSIDEVQVVGFESSTSQPLCWQHHDIQLWHWSGAQLAAF